MSLIISTRWRRAAPSEREAALLAALAARRSRMRARAAPARRASCCAGIDAVGDRLARRRSPRLPVMRKHELLERQKAGAAPRRLRRLRRHRLGCVARAGAAGPRVFASPGPIHEPEGARARLLARWRAPCSPPAFAPATWCTTAFSYHFTPAGSMMESGAHAIGCTVFPAGTGQTELQVQAMADLRPDAYVGTPSFLRILLEKADETGVAPAVR